LQLVSVSSVKKTPRKQKVMLMKKREGRVILLLGGALGKRNTVIFYHTVIRKSLPTDFTVQRRDC